MRVHLVNPGDISFGIAVDHAAMASRPRRQKIGPGRVPGNAQGPCFSRHVSMYLAKRVGRWSLSQIGRFYNGRHHTTVLHAIEKIENLRRTDEAVDALIDVLTAALSLNRLVKHRNQQGRRRDPC
jgi:hypothetical protein